MKVKKSSKKADAALVSRTEIEWTIVNNGYYKKLMQRLSTESCRIILKDREKAKEYARKGLEKMEPEKLTEENIEIYANGMQTLAKIILDKRTKKWLTN